jgi:SAM-dependent methyltransferase
VVVEPSAEVSQSRPFYSRHADAYDLLVADPVEPWVEAVTARVAQPSSMVELLDAGCGTGRHAAAFAARGYSVTLADASADLLAVARRRCPSSPARLIDLCSMAAPPHYHVITCRGVLNDLVTDAEREAAVRAMSQALRPGGLLFCDVREAAASAARADGTPITKRVILPAGGQLTFISTSRWLDGLLLVHEEHVLTSHGADQHSEYQFAMRPWTTEEITDRFTRAGFTEVWIEPGVGRATPDRLTIFAERPD